MRWSELEAKREEQAPEGMYVDGIHLEKQKTMRRMGKVLVGLLREKENIPINQEESEIIERMCAIVIPIDFLIDEEKYPTADIARNISQEDFDNPSLNRALAHLRVLIERHGDYQKYLSDVIRAVSYSSKDSVQDRYRECLYLGKALAAAIRKAGPDREYLEKILKYGTAFVNFLDDVMDYETDEKSVSWMRERRRAAMRTVSKFQRASQNPHSYLPLITAFVLTMYGRRLIPRNLNLLGLK